MRANWVKQTTTSTGTGDLTLSSVSGFPTFAQQFAIGERFSFCVLDSDGKPIFSAIGYLSDSTTLVRELTLVSFVSSTLDNTDPAAVSLSAGTYTVVCAEDEAAFANGLHTLPSFLTGGERRVPACRVANWGSLNTLALAANVMNVWPFEIEHLLRVNKLYLDVSTAAASKVARIGIYSTTADGTPGELLADSGDLSVASATMVSATVGEVRLRPGTYWGAVVSDGAPTIRSFGLFAPPAVFGGSSGTARYMNTRATKAHSYAALPDPFSWASMTVDHTGSSNSIPLIWLGVV